MTNQGRNKAARKNLSSYIQKSIETMPLEIEVLQEDLSDDELLNFTSAFLDDLSTMPKLEKFSLLSPEEAAQAAKMLEAKRCFLEQKMKTATTLKQMLQKRARSDDKYQ